ncbi:hypothetical protein ABVK25_002963 [Lepraria finkii]|uniref:Endonuclease/exonuclease/phosphatase domain-containing protein n=1 Tax=Lepraria finkii TaxID=1340010 RepID=A0ABR4BIF9_9LECA
MSASYMMSPGVSSVDANNAKGELEKWTTTHRSDLSDKVSTRPFEPIPIRNQSTLISEKFQPQARTHAAKILGCPTDQVFFTNHIVMRYNILDRPKPWVSAAHKGKAITIIALGDLNSDNGLPGFGDPPEYCSLQSGQALHALADAPQNFKGHSIGWALVLTWTRRSQMFHSSANAES